MLHCSYLMNNDCIPYSIESPQSINGLFFDYYSRISSKTHTLNVMLDNIFMGIIFRGT